MVLTDVGDLFSDRDLDTWAFFQDNGADQLLVLCGEVDRSVDGGYSDGLDALPTDLGADTSELVRVDLQLSFSSDPHCHATFQV